MVGLRKSFSAENIKCGGCVNTVKKALKDEYGDVLVDLDKEPRAVSIEILEDFDEELFRNKMKSLGYPLSDEELGGVEKLGVKAKSFVSCAIGKMDKSS